MDRRNRHEHLPVAALTAHEYWFFFYALGYSVDKMASIAEHGWSVYSAGRPLFIGSSGFTSLTMRRTGLTNGLDTMWVLKQATRPGYRT